MTGVQTCALPICARTVAAVRERATGQHLIDQPLVGGAIERLADHALGSGDRQVGELFVQLLDRAVAFRLHLFTSPRHDLIGVITCPLDRKSVV